MRTRRRCLLAVLAASLLVAAGPASAGAATMVDAAVPAIDGTASQSGRLVADGTTSTCAARSPAPAVTQSGAPFDRRLHTFGGTMVEPACIIVRVTTACAGADAISSAAYLPAHVAAAPAENHVADFGGAVASTGVYGFVAPAGSPFAVTVYEMNVGAGCAGYQLKVSSVGPWATARPTVSGAAAVGSTLTGADAAWKADPVPTVTRQWRRCDRAGAACVDIPGATAASYTVADADLGGTLRFRNTATEAGGTNSSDSPPVDPYIPFFALTDALGPGDRVQQGTFVRNNVETRCGVPPATVPTILQPAMTYLYDTAPVTSLLNEEACLVASVAPGGCFGGASPSIHSPAFVPGAIGTAYRGNAGGDANVAGTAAWLLPPGASAEVATSTIQPSTPCATYGLTFGADAPFALARPEVGGAAVEAGPGLTASTGTWSGTPALAYAWLRCDASGAACAPIPGATGGVYVPTAEDVGGRLRVRVSATQGRTVSSDSAPSAPIAAAPARPTTPPTPPPPVVAPPPPRDTRAPLARLTVPRTSLQTVLRRGWLPLAVRCDEACRMTVEARVTRKVARRAGGRATVARTTATNLLAGRTTTARVKLTRAALRALRRNRQAALSLTFHVTVVDVAGNRRPLTLRARVVRSRRR